MKFLEGDLIDRTGENVDVSRESVFARVCVVISCTQHWLAEEERGICQRMLRSNGICGLQVGNVTKVLS